MKKILSIVLVLVLSLGSFSLASFAATDTTEHLTEVPEGYVGVYTIEDLYCVRNDLTANYILMNDIDLTEATAEGGDWDFYGNGWNPIGSKDVYGNSEFKGIFDGNGYAVKGMRIEINNIPSGTGDMYLGLFSSVSGTIKNLTVEGNIYASVKRNNNLYIGGIAGYNSGTIDNCTNKVEIFANTETTVNHTCYLYVGGITGGNGGTVSNCINIKDIGCECSDMSAQAAGICGYNLSTGKIKKCINTGNITVTAEYSTEYKECYVAGIGSARINNNVPGIISNCYNTGEIVASSASISICYAAGIGYLATCSYSYNVGAVSGYKNYAISNVSATKCYYLAGVGSDSTGATSLTPAQMKLESMYQSWDFDTVWTMDGRADYPYPELRDVDLVLPEDLLHQHEYTSEITTPATHLTEGVKTFTCECGDTYTEVIAKIKEHSYSKTVTAPTCTAQGYTTYTCACGDSYISDYINATNHIDGNGDYKCDYNCGYEFERPAPEVPDEPQEETKDGLFAKIIDLIKRFFDLVFSVFKK